MSLIKEAADEIKKMRYINKDLRNFGILIGGLLTAHTLYVYLRYHHVPLIGVGFIIGLLLLIAAFVKPAALKIPYICWMSLAVVLGLLVSRILVIFIFCFLVTPIGSIMQLFGKSPLDTRFKDTRESYWITKEGRANHYKKLF